MTKTAIVGRAGPIENEARRKIVDAAIHCFSERGPQQTSMTDIAAAAGISRKTLYRVFEDRPKLIEQILVQRWNVLGGKVRKRLASFRDFNEAVVEGSIYSVSIGRRDELTHVITQHETNRRLEQFLVRGNDEVFGGMVQNWLPVINLGREQGVIRENLSDERIVEIIMSIHAVLIMRDDYTREQQRGFLKDVLLPSLTKQ